MAVAAAFARRQQSVPTLESVSDDSTERLERMRAKLRKPTAEEAAAREVQSAAAQPALLRLVEQIAQGTGDPYEVAHDLYRAAMGWPRRSERREGVRPLQRVDRVRRSWELPRGAYA
jgi:hypothetical protein